VRYSLCRLNAGSGGEDLDEPPDCLYGLQVRGPPFSLGGSLFWVLWGVSVWGIGLAVRWFLCAGEYVALLVEHGWSGPQHPAYEGVTFPGILFMTWRAQGVMNGWLLVFLFKVCCHKAS